MSRNTANHSVELQSARVEYKKLPHPSTTRAIRRVALRKTTGPLSRGKAEQLIERVAVISTTPKQAVLELGLEV